MRLKNVEKEKQQWINKGYEVFNYNREQVRENTKKRPEWVHFGAGNLFRAYQSVFQDKLLNEGFSDTGIIAVGGRNSANIDDYFKPFDNCHIAVTLEPDGSVSKRVIGSVVEALKIEEMDKLKGVFEKESLKVASFTITEKGYKVIDDVASDCFNDQSASYMGKVAMLLYHRYCHGGYPLTLVSMDNCSHNGDVLKNSIMQYVHAMNNDGFEDYVNNKLSFPISMIDKITPRPDKTVMDILSEDKVEDLCDPSYYMNCFSNAETTEYLVIENSFVNGRPLWDKTGVIFTDRKTVDKVEKMKVCTCLNPVHTALAIFGNLLGYKLIWKEMQDELLVKLVKHIGYDEGLPVVVDPKILNPKEFLDTVINVRITNPFMPDSPQRIGMDTSQKISVRFGETLKAYIAKGKDVTKLTFIPLTFAGWLRYLTGIDDEGNEFEIPFDPLLPELKSIIGRYSIGDTIEISNIKEIISDEKLFGVDLIKVGLAEKIIVFLNEMLLQEGAVRKTLEKYV